MSSTIRSVADDLDFHLELVDDRDELVFDERLRRVDFERAISATWFAAFLAGTAEEYVSGQDRVRIEAVFVDGPQQSPRARGFRVIAMLPSGAEHVQEFGLQYFSSQAARLREKLVRTKQLEADQQVVYRLSAYYDEHRPPQRPKLPITLEPGTPIVTIRTAKQTDYGPLEAWDTPDADFRVLVDRAVLQEAVEESRNAPAREIGGFLLGNLLRDEPSGRVFIAVTGLATAGDTSESTATSVTFTPATFVQVQQIIQLRGAQETIVGWYHSHPFRFCDECPLPTPPECIAKVLFYSQDDIHLMETTFAQPFMVGLLTAVEPRLEAAIGHLPVRLFGWRDGTIRQRGLHVFELPVR